jgi:hypothetical protein
MGNAVYLSTLFEVFSGRCLERRRIHSGYTNDMFSPFLNGLVRKSFKRLPTATEWARFRKYARRMRELSYCGVQKTLSSEVYSVIQLHAANEPLLPNLTTLNLRAIGEPLIPFLPLFLSPTITSISLGSLRCISPSHGRFSDRKLADNLPQFARYQPPVLPRDPMITTAASKMFFATNRNALREFHVDSPLTEEATEAISKSQNLRSLSVVIEKGTPIPSASLPNLTRLQIQCKDGSDGLLLLRGATFGKLESVNFDIESRLTDDFLEAFKGTALSSSIQIRSRRSVSPQIVHGTRIIPLSFHLRVW